MFPILYGAVSSSAQWVKVDRKDRRRAELFSGLHGDHQEWEMQ